ncbi:hypothetical protein [uncultured Salinisphaera sp.]|tara:strand:+ start:27914 stop:28045 length:132 start_codon:yes stop_codon:yes gene_type:complete
MRGFKQLDAAGFDGAPLGDTFKTVDRADAAATLQVREPAVVSA